MTAEHLPTPEQCDCAGFCQEKTGCRGLPRRMAGHNHASSAEKAVCPACNPDKTPFRTSNEETLDRAIAYFAAHDRNDGIIFHNDATVRETLTLLRELKERRAHETTACEWCEVGIPRSKDGARHESIYGVWACSSPQNGNGDV